LTGVVNKSPEFSVLFDPASTFRQLAAEQTAGLWVLIRRPLRLLFVCGCVVSLWASGRLGVRLIADGAVSFAFLPIFSLAALAAVYRLSPRRVSFAQAADLFSIANAPWLVWLVAFAALRCIESPTQAAAQPVLVSLILKLSLVLVAAWSMYVDLCFFREVLPHPAGSARNLILQRAIGWTCSVVYFFGIAIWPMIVGRLG
jgi:hypothetical protein